MAYTSTLRGHLVLLSDTLRVNTYGKAIRRQVRPGDVVVDLGSGSGVMARFAAQAGASRVVAFEQSAELCRVHELSNYMMGLDEVIEVVQGEVEDARLEHEIDVVISELIGSFVDDEGMSQVLSAFCDANRGRFAADVRFVPEDVVLYGQLVEDAGGPEPTTRAGKEAASGLRRAARGEVLVLTNLEGLATVGEPFRLLSVSGDGTREGGRGEQVADFHAVGKQENPPAMACWFEATLAGGVVLDSRGSDGVNTTWGWPLVPVSAMRAPAGARLDEVKLSFRLHAREDGELEVDAAWTP